MISRGKSLYNAATPKLTAIDAISRFSKLVISFLRDYDLRASSNDHIHIFYGNKRIIECI